MKLIELKKLIDEWLATGDWDDTEIMIYNEAGDLLSPPMLGITREDGGDILEFY